MVNLLTCWHSNRNLAVNIGQQLVASIARNNAEMTVQSIPIGTADNITVNLLKLVTAIATVQTRRINPTRLNKLLEVLSKSDLLGYTRECDDFCITRNPDSDKQRTISEDLGVGLSVLVTDHYYKINWATLGKIPRGNESEPDIKCKSISKESIVIEAKGSVSRDWRNEQIDYAHIQKHGPLPSHVFVASCALLSENGISDVEYFDPPLIPPEDEEYETSLLKADHYARVFNLIGQEELSRYFGYMRERIILDRDMKQFDKKQELYQKIKTTYVRLRIEDRQFFGNIERDDDESLFFVGVDGGLLNVDSFINFDGLMDKHVNVGEDDFYLSSDGLCMGFLKSLKLVEGQITMQQVPHHYDVFSISDFDYDREQTILNYVSYLIRKIGGKVLREQFLEHQYDLLFSLDNRQFAIEIKRSISNRNIERILAQLQRMPAKSQFKLVLITNTRLDDKVSTIIRSRGIISIDRVGLRTIIDNNQRFLDFLQEG